jgi:hypothetical protein
MFACGCCSQAHVVSAACVAPCLPEVSDSWVLGSAPLIRDSAKRIPLRYGIAVHRTMHSMSAGYLHFCRNRRGADSAQELSGCSRLKRVHDLRHCVRSRCMERIFIR